MGIQLEGAITLDSTDYSDEISEFVLTITRATVTEMATYADASENESAGVQNATVTITAKNSGAAASLNQALYAAILTDSAELPFTARYQSGAVAADNPEYSGTLVVTEVQLGNRVGDEMMQSQTFPAKGITQAVA